MPALEGCISDLPTGQRLFAISILAHGMNLKEEYLKAQGVVQTAMLMADAVYPIPFIYLNCIAAMCQINQKEQEEAISSVKKAISFAGNASGAG